MPSKRAKGDWAWVSEVDDASGITDDHRLRAAGLRGLVECPYVFSLEKTEVPAKDKNCTRRRCELNPACLNHVGVASLLDRKKGKEKYVEDRLPPVRMRGWMTRDLNVNGSTTSLRDGLKGSNEGEGGPSSEASSSKVTLGMAPAGLRNLGATCYANAFLQLWFYNVAFRNAIYACSPVPGSPLFHLAFIFASLQHSPQSYVDPTGLIEALRLDKTDQQDAGEFSKLFLDLISAELSKQKDVKLRTFTQDLFEGRKEITITCDCGYQSPRSEEYLELEIPLKDGEGLLDRLRYSLASERLEGSNQYNCPACHSKRDATRSTRLTFVPPVLQFTLVRFAYDKKAQERKKSKAAINFPRTLELGDHEYHLHAIVAHHGPNAHQGHFVCEALDERAGCWWMCNDEEVTRISRSVRSNSWNSGLDGNSESAPPPSKRAKLSSSMLSSRDAYMLVYSRAPPTTPIDPPPEIMTKVEDDTRKWEHQMGDRERKKYILEEEYDAVTSAKRQVAAILPGHDRLLPSTALERWFAAATVEELFGPWSISTCPHGAIAPGTVPEFKLVSQAAFDLLADYCTAGPGDSEAKAEDRTRSTSSSGPNEITYTALPQLGVCPECVSEAYSEKTVTSIELSAEQRAAWLAEVKLDRTLIRKCLDPESIAFRMEYYYLPKSFVDEWIAYTEKPLAARPHLAANLGRCEHGLLDLDLEKDDAHYTSEGAWQQLTEMYGQSPPITFQFDENDTPERRHAKIDCSVPTCNPCRTKRLLEFEETEIHVRLEKAKEKTQMKSRRSKHREAPLTVTKSTKMVDIKVQIMNDSGLTPVYQILSHNGRELANEETVESAHILSGDMIVCREVVVEDLTQNDVTEERGFGGTALRGRQACPDCTFENDSGATACEVCQRPFGYD